MRRHHARVRHQRGLRENGTRSRPHLCALRWPTGGGSERAGRGVAGLRVVAARAVGATGVASGAKRHDRDAAGHRGEGDQTGGILHRPRVLLLVGQAYAQTHNHHHRHDHRHRHHYHHYHHHQYHHRHRKNWRGPMEQRPSVGATWGNELISSFGPFEMIDMCVAAGFEPIITTTGQVTRITSSILPLSPPRTPPIPARAAAVARPRTWLTSWSTAGATPGGVGGVMCVGGGRVCACHMGI